MNWNKKQTERIHKQIQELYEQDMMQIEIANKLHISRSYVNRAIKKIKERRSEPPLPQERRSEPPVPQERRSMPQEPQERRSMPQEPQERRSMPQEPQERRSEPPVPQRKTGCLGWFFFLLAGIIVPVACILYLPSPYAYAGYPIFIITFSWFFWKG